MMKLNEMTFTFGIVQTFKAISIDENILISDKSDVYTRIPAFSRWINANTKPTPNISLVIHTQSRKLLWIVVVSAVVSCTALPFLAIYLIVRHERSIRSQPTASDSSHDVATPVSELQHISNVQPISNQERVNDGDNQLYPNPYALASAPYPHFSLPNQDLHPNHSHINPPPYDPPHYQSLV